jgi:hypothetical protein
MVSRIGPRIQLQNVVLAHQGHCTRLGPSFAHLFHEAHLGADFQFIEGIVQHTVTVKIDKPFVRGVRSDINSPAGHLNRIR